MDIKTVLTVSDGGPGAATRRSPGCNGPAFQGNCGGSPSATCACQEDSMLVNLHLWEAPVRNLDWVTSAFGYR